MNTLTVREVFDLPTDIPRCIVQIRDFDDQQTLEQNIRDYVITDTVAEEMERLVDRIVTSCKRQSAGEGHYLHGSFGSGKSHFMAILGLILENNPAIWTKQHPAIQRIQEKHGAWLAANPILVVPVYMLGQSALRTACYNAANERLRAVGKAPCEFSEAGKVIEAFRTRAARYGDVVYQQFEAATGLARARVERMAGGDQAARDDLAGKILAFENPGRAERASLYPDKFSDGMAALTRHVQDQGFGGIVYLIDELILYLTGKTGATYVDEFNDLVALADNSSLDRAVPLWVIVSKQRNIAELVPDDRSEQRIHDVMEHHKDRFPETTELADTELVPIVQERVLRLRAGMQEPLDDAVQRTLTSLAPEVRETLLSDLTLADFSRVYPFHPALIRTLVEVSARLSRDRSAIRLLYELLIRRHPDLKIGALVPYASLFDAVFLPNKLTGDSRNQDLEAVRQTYYEKLLPVLQETYRGREDDLRKAELIVKTVLLCGLSRSMRDGITVDRILHLNYHDLMGRTTLGSVGSIAQILAELDNRTELVQFTANPAKPGQGTVAITLASGAQLSDVMKRVRVNWRQQTEAFTDLMKELLGKPIQNGEIPNYERTWRGSKRRGRVRFAHVSELATNDMSIRDGDEFTLYVDYPFAAGLTGTRADDRAVIDAARRARGPVEIGFWLPAEFTVDDLRDLEEYAQLVEIESNPEEYLKEYGRTPREALESKLFAQKTSKARALRDRLEQAYRGPGASVSFLDPAITPSLDVQSVGAALDRIADAVCDKRYPHHPRFPVELNQRSLRRLLEDFLVPAATGNGSVRRTPDLDSYMTRLGRPLELADEGALNWTLRAQSRYLGKLDELAAGKRVEVEKLRRGLVDAFGFNKDLCDTFILYLIKGQGWRALRKGQPEADVDYGRLDGLTLERGERLQPHEWSLVKLLALDAWQVRAATQDLSIAAQDQLWLQISKAAEPVKDALARLRASLEDRLKAAGVEQAASARLAELKAAIALNQAALESGVDPTVGLRQLLNWQPTGSSEGATVMRDAAVKQIANRVNTKSSLDSLKRETIDRISQLASRGNPDAGAALSGLAGFLVASAAEADLGSYVASWIREAEGVITDALRTPSMTAASVAGATTERRISEAEAEWAAAEEPGASWQIAEACAELGGKTIRLDAPVVAALRQIVQQMQAASEGSEPAPGDEIVIRIALSRGSE